MLPLKLEKVKVKVKISLEQAMKARRGSRGIALLFL
jgi:ribosome maturation protein Sdo1